MGVITMGLLAGGMIPSFHVPLWVIALSSGAIAAGTALGGWRLIRTLGAKIYRIRPIHGFASQIAGASVIMGAALVGGPVSTTQVMSSAIMGVGAAERLNTVRWLVLRDLATAWLLTIPATAPRRRPAGVNVLGVWSADQRRTSFRSSDTLQYSGRQSTYRRA
jgi:PiT family inorganic phosphate transporter